jgi:hypothetical protein
MRRKDGDHGRYVVYQMAEVAMSRNLFADILRLIAELRPPRVKKGVSPAIGASDCATCQNGAVKG